MDANTHHEQWDIQYIIKDNPTIASSRRVKRIPGISKRAENLDSFEVWSRYPRVDAPKKTNKLQRKTDCHLADRDS